MLSEQYRFKFFIEDVENNLSGANEKTAIVTSILLFERKEVFSGIVRVRLNEFGIFPVAEDISAFSEQLSIRRALAAEIRKYIKPQKRFL
ncbi:hypothetical protein [Bacillus sp. T33-2]|uniref:hypothetical protein n=1 Tax=Bacillus sp. T33-2 TaxID=2054168 RepID=UPI000C756E6E|nr:hypothetical protein [Bacillus sp. T33-2]PLR98844.1 hypothetical protein CVD19_04210 [Bacillus sp. T33-2]